MIPTYPGIHFCIMMIHQIHSQFFSHPVCFLPIFYCFISAQLFFRGPLVFVWKRLQKTLLWNEMMIALKLLARR